MKRTLFISLLVLALLLAACGSSATGGQGQPSSSNKSQLTQPTSTTQPETPTETPKPSFYKVGEVVTISKVVQITVTQAKRLPFSQADPGTSPEGGWPKDGEFLTVSVTMTNLGTEPLQVTGFSYGLRDAEGNNPLVWIWGVSGTQELPTGTAPMGQKIKGDVSFMVEKGVTPYFFSFEDPIKLPHPLFWRID